MGKHPLIKILSNINSDANTFLIMKNITLYKIKTSLNPNLIITEETDTLLFYIENCIVTSVNGGFFKGVLDSFQMNNSILIIEDYVLETNLITVTSLFWPIKVKSFIISNCDFVGSKLIDNVFFKNFIR